MKKHLRLLAFACYMFVGSAFQRVEAASLQHSGNTTYDPNTGLQWLDLNLTAGQSYNSVLGGWGGYTTTEGFRFATRSELIQLFTDAGASSIGYPPTTADLQAATLVLSLLGTTAGESRSWMLYDPSTEPTLPNSSYVPCAVINVGPPFAGYPDEGQFVVPGLFPTTDYASSTIASALVRAVPEPSTAILLTACISLGLVVNHRRKSLSSSTWRATNRRRCQGQ